MTSGTPAGGTWVAYQGGSARYTPSIGGQTLGEPNATTRDRSANGLTFWVDVYLEANAVGNWDVALQTQDNSFNFIRPGGSSGYRRAK